MSATIVDGKSIASTIEERVATRVVQLKHQGTPPSLAVILVGEHKPSLTYVKRKQQACERVGIEFVLEQFVETTTEDEIISTLKDLQLERKVSGVIVQLPLPEGFDSRRILEYIKVRHDVDVLTREHLGGLMEGRQLWYPPTPGGILEILEHHNMDLAGKHVVLVGRGMLVGRPLVNMFSHLPVTVTVCGSASKPLDQYVRQGDVVICGVGKAGIVTGDMLKPGAVVIDAGVSFEDGKMMGDVDFESVAGVASLVTPTPGGVGPLTVAKLLENTVKAATFNIKR